MALTTTSTVDDILPKFLAEARMVAEHSRVMENLVDKISLPRGEGLSVNVPKFNRLSAANLTEGVDMQQAQTISDTGLVITPSEVGIQVVITDKALRSVSEPLMRRAGAIMGNAMARKRDVDLLTMLDGFATSQPGAGATLGIGHIQAQVARIRANSAEPGPMPIHTVLHDFQYYDIAQDLLNIGSGVLGTVDGIPEGPSADVLRDHYVGRLVGTSIFVDNNISVDASDDAKGGVFSQKALIFVPVLEDITSTERDESLRATEVNHISEYGIGEYVDLWGAEIYSDATTPTA